MRAGGGARRTRVVLIWERRRAAGGALANGFLLSARQLNRSNAFKRYSRPELPRHVLSGVWSSQRHDRLTRSRHAQQSSDLLLACCCCPFCTCLHPHHYFPPQVARQGCVMFFVRELKAEGMIGHGLNFSSPLLFSPSPIPPLSKAISLSLLTLSIPHFPKY